MAVLFYCSCGRRLKARHRQRGFISFCPGCGAAVKVPTDKTTHRGVAAMTEAERLAMPLPRATAASEGPPVLTGSCGAVRENRIPPLRPTGDVPPPPATGDGVDPPPAISLRGRKNPAPKARSREGRESWVESLRYTLAVVPAMLLLTVFLTASLEAALRGLADLNSAAPSGTFRHLFFPSAAVLIGILACSAAFLSSVLDLSLESSPRIAGFPNLDAILRASAQWTACLAAGPAVLLAAAAIYWVWFGDPTLIDDVILVELVALSTGWFVAALVNTTGKGRFWRFHPAAVLSVVSAEFGRFVVTCFVGSICVFGLARLGALAIARAHLSAFEGALWLALFWFAGLASAAVAFRRLGLRHERPAAPAPAPALPSRPAKQRGSRIALSRTPG